jgi:signal transduction histidine kinase
MGRSQFPRTRGPGLGGQKEDPFRFHRVSSYSISQTELLELAPVDLDNRRSKRYHGDNLAISMVAFVESDKAVIIELYEFLRELLDVLDKEDREETRITEMLNPGKIERLIDNVRQLGKRGYEVDRDPLLEKTLHDLRGGGLTPLFGLIQYANLDGHTPAILASLFFLTRDHLKIMRNALLGLDDAARTRDLEIKLHSTDLIVEKWDGTRLKSGKGEIRLAVHCPESVDISECCVEFGALDRILYNLLNNACRHTARSVIDLVLFPVPDRGGRNLRCVLLNALAAADEAHLRNVDLGTLFDAGVSTTGSSYGLSVVAEFVANAFGLGSPDRAVAGKYVGVALRQSQFVIWFHWPIVSND